MVKLWGTDLFSMCSEYSSDITPIITHRALRGHRGGHTDNVHRGNSSGSVLFIYVKELIIPNDCLKVFRVSEAPDFKGRWFRL